MPNQSNRLLYAVLFGGLLFLLAAGFLVINLLSESPAAEPVIVAVDVPATDEASAPIPATVADEATSTPISPTLTETDTLAETPIPTSTSITITGDTLSLPTATPTLSPSPTPTDTPAPIRPAVTSPPTAGLRVGDIAPDFTLGSNLASRVSLSELRGKIVILNFWASWCPPCRHEVPALQAIHNEFGPQGVVVLAVNQKEKLSNVERFAHDNGIKFAVWLDEDGWAGNIYQVHSIPTTYFIDEDGIIRAVQTGSMTREQVLDHLEELL